MVSPEFLSQLGLSKTHFRSCSPDTTSSRTLYSDPTPGFDIQMLHPSPISCPPALTSSFTLQLVWVDLSVLASCAACAGPASESSIAAEMWWLPEDS